MSFNSNTKALKRQSVYSNDKQVESEVVSKRRGTEEEEAEYEKKEEEEAAVEVSSVTRQLCIKPIENMDKEVVLRRIRQRKRVNKVRASVGSFLSSTFTNNNTVTDKGNESGRSLRWVDDPFAAL